MAEENMTTTPRENKMGTMPVNKLLITMAAPMMLSMLIQALYNIVDSIYVAQIEEYALTAVSLAFPMQNIMISVGVGIGVGVNAWLSKHLGEKQPEKANQVALHGMFLEVLAYILFVIVGLVGIDAFMRGQTDIPEIIAYGDTYLRICVFASFGVFIQIGCERLLMATGRTVYTMIIQGAGAVINIVLDPILIFGWFGLPAMGIAGAAWATVIGQIAGAVLGLIFNMKWNPDVRLNYRGFKVELDVVKRILSLGIPSIIMSSIGSVMTFLMNKILMGFSSTATTVFGVYFKLQSFAFMPVFGMNNAMVPILGYNYGAKRKDRMMQTIKTAMFYAVGIMLVCLAVFQLLPDKLLLLFNASDHMLEIGVPALRLISLSYIFAGICVVSGSVFQALGNGFYSMMVSVARQLLILVPVAWLLSLTGNLDLVWLSFPIAELASIGTSAFFLRKIYKQKISAL
ncbi:MAG: MATE family efflux transporter [Lachnospiraceae bacterium]|nr:MATE family efflux transporter [Lachnospiraceae bacterium]